MASNSGNLLPESLFLPRDISNANIKPEALRDLLLNLYNNLNDMTLAINSKESGTHSGQEIITSKVYFPSPSGTPLGERPSSRVTVNFGALPNAGSKSVAHGLTLIAGYSFAVISGAASDTTLVSGISIPHCSTVLNKNVSVSVDATNVTITTGIDRTNFDTCMIDVEYLKL